MRVASADHRAQSPAAPRPTVLRVRARPGAAHDGLRLHGIAAMQVDSSDSNPSGRVVSLADAREGADAPSAGASLADHEATRSRARSRGYSMIKRLVAMLIATGIIFGAIFGFIMYRDAAIARSIAGRQPPAVPVSVLTLQSTDWVSTIESIGLLESAQGVDVTTEVGGLVPEPKSDSGQEVHRDDVLVRLDDSVEQGELRQAQAQLPAAVSNLQRYQQLAAQGNAPLMRLDEVRSRHDSLVQQITSLQATVARKTIRAPFDGTLGVRRINLGQLVNPGTIIANLQNVNAMRVSLIVSQRDMARVQEGFPVEARVDAYPSRQFTGNVIAIEPSVNAQSGIVRVQAEI